MTLKAFKELELNKTLERIDELSRGRHKFNDYLKKYIILIEKFSERS